MIRSGPRAGHVVMVDRPMVIGRTQGEVLLADDELMSGRHARIAPQDRGLVIEDLGSRNGTIVNGAVLRAPAILSAGDRLVLGDTVVDVQADAIDAAPPTPSGRSTRVGGLIEHTTGDGVVAYRPGTFGASVANEVAASLAAACKRLAPLTAVTGGVAPRIVISDPVRDPGSPDHIVTRGSVLDTERDEIWLVVTAESPAEPLERPLALLLGTRLPAGGELGPLLEGYGLLAGGAEDPVDLLRDAELPPLSRAEGDLAVAMALSFASFLVGRVGEEAFMRFLADARPGRLDAAAEAIFGHDLAALERTWRASLQGQGAVVGTSRFLRLAGTYLRPYWRRELELLVLSLLSLTFVVALPFALRSLLNDAIPSGSFGRVAVILAELGAAAAVTLVAGLRETYQVSYVGASIIRSLRLRMFERLQQLHLGWFAARDSGDVITRLVADVELLEQGLSQAIRDGVVQLMTFGVAGITALIINVWLGLLVLLMAPIVAVLFRVMKAGAQQRSFASQQRLGAVTGVFAENLGAQAIVKAYGLERREQSRLREACDSLFASVIRLSLFTGLFRLSVQLLTTTLSIVVIGLGAWLIIHHHFTIGGLVAFIAILDRVTSPATALAGIGAQIQASSGALLRINEVLDARAATRELPDAIALPRLQRMIELRGVSFSYSPGRPVLSDLTVRIRAGSRVAFVGPSGAGKSSIVQLLLRFSDPDVGAVLFDEVDIRGASLSSLRGQIGVVPQQTFLFNASIAENIALGRQEASADEVQRAAIRASLDAAALPEGLATKVGERGALLSGGQAQRVAIARALVRDPAILILDEATSALDPRTERDVAKTLELAGAGRTVIAVTHRLASVRDYDEIFVVDDGRIVEHGTHAELLASAGVYADLWAEQTSGAPPRTDLTADLARLPLFADLAPDELAEVEGALEPLVLRTGERLLESSQTLAIVARGNGRILVPVVGGRLARIAELRPGQAFGLSALLGEPTGSVLEATSQLSLLCLDSDALQRLADRIPAVAGSLGDKQATAISPARGRRLRSGVLTTQGIPLASTASGS